MRRVLLLQRQRVIVVGAGVFAKSVAETIVSNRSYKFLGFAVDKEFANSAAGDARRPVWLLGEDPLSDATLKRNRLFVALGPQSMSRSRRELVERCRSYGYALTSIVAESADVNAKALGQNTYIGSGARVSREAIIGEGSIIHENAVIAAHAVVGAYSYVGPGAVVGSYATIGEHSVLGLGSMVKTSVNVGEGALVGAGCFVSRNIPPRGLVARQSDEMFGSFSEALLAMFFEGKLDASGE